MLLLKALSGMYALCPVSYLEQFTTYLLCLKVDGRFNKALLWPQDMTNARTANLLLRYGDILQWVLFLKVLTNLTSKEKNGANVPQMLCYSNIFYLVGWFLSVPAKGML